VDNQSGKPAAPIDIVGLVKSFGRIKVLNKLNLNVAPGEVHGFLGPNGAGKTTILRVLLGLLRADAGTLRLLGRDDGSMRWTCTGVWPRFLATCHCGQPSPAAR
jgi:ABC-type multidrug transport system ATPase subunit